MAVIGPDTEALGEIKKEGQYYQAQMAKTAAAFMGLDYKNEKKVADVLQLMFRK